MFTGSTLWKDMAWGTVLGNPEIKKTIVNQTKYMQI